MTKQFFTDPAAQKIWDLYLARVARSAWALDESRRRELVLEIQDHLYESYSRQEGDDEAARLDVAIERMGEPEEYIRPLLADRLLEDASRSHNPRTIAAGLWYNTARGLKAMGVTLLFFLGYMASFAFLAMALRKPFTPDQVGFFVFDGGMSLGMFDSAPPGSREILGWYMVPMGLCLSLVIYLTLTRLLREIRASR